MILWLDKDPKWFCAFMEAYHDRFSLERGIRPQENGVRQAVKYSSSSSSLYKLFELSLWTWTSIPASIIAKKSVYKALLLLSTWFSPCAAGSWFTRPLKLSSVELQSVHLSVFEERSPAL